MSSFPVGFKKLVDDHSPALLVGKDLDPSLRALISVLADREKVSIAAWLDRQVRASLVAIVPESVQNAHAAGEFVLWGQTKLNDWRALPRQQMGDLMSNWDVFEAVATLRPEIEELLTRPAHRSPLDDKRVPMKRRHVLFDASAVASAATSRDEEKKAWVTRLQASGHEREILRVRAAMVRRVERLLADAPNLREATQFVLNQLALSQRDGNRLSLPPLLLVGPPAAGKTWWAEELAKALGVRSELVPMGSVTSSFELAGGSSSWTAGRPGRILRAYLDTTSASPIFVFDEVEKISAGNYDPAPVLLHLIEKATAARFRDEFFDAEFDVSPAIFIATANDAGRMDPALRSRFREVCVRAPVGQEREPIVASIWRTLRGERKGLQLPPRLDARVMALLVDAFKDARQIHRLIEDGLGRAARRPGPLELLSVDVGGAAVHLVRATPPRVASIAPDPRP